ncbi:MAG: aspartate aminotransferase family protein [Actinomycetota bacterium]|nr:aspartate aminotransferase family protein [Actinomycetota bacterium]
MQEKNKNVLLNEDLIQKGAKFLMHTYSRMDIVFCKAEMQYLWDVEGKKYTDFTSGYGCLNVGHSNPAVIKTLQEQINKIIQPSNIFYNIPQVELAEKLCHISGFGEKVFFSNSGAEAVEGAIKLARKYSTDKYGKRRYEIITFNNSFHGRTLGALAATAQAKKQNMFEPLLSGFKYADINDIGSVKKQIDDNTCAVIIELIQGEGGINVCKKEFIRELKKICEDNELLLIIDEIQTGFSRTGSIFAYQQYDIVPDIVVVAKSLGGGMPIGAIISTDKICSVFTPGTHGSTFGGNAASCSAGIAVIKYMLDNDLAGRAEKLGKYLASRLNILKSKYDIVLEIRGLGLMLAIEFKKPIASELMKNALENGLVLNKLSETTIRFLPSLVINEKDIDILINFLDRYIKGEIKNER